jgi:Fe-S-cluster containining protein
MRGRHRYPEHEARHPWLSRLLRAYHICDTAAREELARESARRGAPPACGPGCSVCCRGQVIPVSAFEAIGLYWFAGEMLTEPVRAIVRGNLKAHRPEDDAPDCPFLARDACAVYPLRPFICRQHHVFGRRCRPGENLRMERPGDVFNTGHDHARAMAAEYLPLLGVADEDVDWRFESGYVAQRSRNLHSLPLWNILARMDGAGRRRGAHA